MEKDEREKELPFCAIRKVIFELSHYLYVCVCVCVGDYVQGKLIKQEPNMNSLCLYWKGWKNSIGKNSLKKVLNEESAKRTQILLNEPQ